MSKKQKKDQVFQEFDPAIEQLALERLLGGKQIFDYKTKRLLPKIRDEAQARGVLLRAETLAQQFGKTLVLRSKEKQLLQRTLLMLEVLAIAASFVSLAMLSDSDNDGTPDILDSPVHLVECNGAQF